jgi:hypothetical protein
MLTPEIAVVGTIVVVGGYRRYHAVHPRLCLWIRILGGAINRRSLFVDGGFSHICTFIVFAPSERLITPEGKLRHLKSDTPRRVVEVIARTFGAGIAIFTIVYLIRYRLDTWEILSKHGPADDLRQPHRPELYREELVALSRHYSPSVQNYSFD